jgi:hypothetical protein
MAYGTTAKATIEERAEVVRLREAGRSIRDRRRSLW